MPKSSANNYVHTLREVLTCVNQDSCNTKPGRKQEQTDQAKTTNIFVDGWYLNSLFYNFSQPGHRMSSPLLCDSKVLNCASISIFVIISND